MKTEWSKNPEGHWTIHSGHLLGCGLRIDVQHAMGNSKQWHWSAPALGVDSRWLGDGISEDEAKSLAIEGVTDLVLKLCIDMGEIRRAP